MECKELFTLVQLQNQRYKTELCKSAGVINYKAMPINFNQHIQPYTYSYNKSPKAMICCLLKIDSQ